jgi:4-alpha-glucanotransferase
VTFRLRTDRQNSSQPKIYGNIPELGNNDPEKGIPLYSSNGKYNFTAKITLDKPYEAGQVYYSYCFQPPYGALINETIPRRYAPKLDSDLTIYDNTNSINPIGDIVIHFSIRCHTEYGQELYICGNTPQLGEWKSERAVQLSYAGHEDYWFADIRFPISNKPISIEYKYFISYSPGNFSWEPESNHTFTLAASSSPAFIEIADQYRWSDNYMNCFSRSAFIDAINRRNNPKADTPIETDKAEPDTLILHFFVNAPYVRKHQTVAVVGSIPELGSWDIRNALQLFDADFPTWRGHLKIPRYNSRFEYKYVIVNKDDPFNPKTAIWEKEANRWCPGVTSQLLDDAYPATLVINEWFVCPNRDLFRGLGVYSPVFALRSSESCGIGSYTDIKGLVDVCNKIGASLIQLLPINDTTDKGEWADSYPYRQVSCFALHPIYINLLQAIPDLPSDLRSEIDRFKWEAEQPKVIDYPKVYQFKKYMLEKEFKVVAPTLAKNAAFQKFIKDNAAWLNPYALYCYFRKEYGTSDFHQWPKYQTLPEEEVESLVKAHEADLQYTYWLQYLCDKQFKEAVTYANEHGVALKGDLPIGVYLNSVEVWAWPKNFRLHECAGAPPDGFSDQGQNWEFPTYDWDYMATDNFRWWRMRLQRMAQLFQALRVDHVLGFFRIWEIPRETCKGGMLGHFFPCWTVSEDELRGRGLWDIDRYVNPYIRWHILWDKFKDEAKAVADKYLEPLGWSYQDDYFRFKEEYNNERKIAEKIDADPSFNGDEGKRKHYKTCLTQLVDNVLLIRDENYGNQYHLRTNITIEHVNVNPWGIQEVGSTSWLELPEDQRNAIKDLYIDFTYKRQTGLWVDKARPKLGILKGSTNMLICAEDLGQITEGIIQCLQESGLLSLEVQRMSKDPKHNFADAHHFPYLSVCCPSTHDMPSLRGWWKINRGEIEEFWRTMLWRWDPCPQECEPFVQEMIFKQHMWSNSMWAIFLLQDITGIIGDLRRQTPEEEQINVPAEGANHHWNYRYPWTLDELVNNEEFTSKIYGIIRESHRI